MATDSAGNFLSLESLGAVSSYDKDMNEQIDLTKVCFSLFQDSESEDTYIGIGYFNDSGYIQVDYKGFNLDIDGVHFDESYLIYSDMLKELANHITINLNNEFEFVQNIYGTGGNDDTSYDPSIAYCDGTAPDQGDYSPSYRRHIKVIRKDFLGSIVDNNYNYLDGDLQACCFKDANQTPITDKNTYLSSGDYRQVGQGIGKSLPPRPNLYDTCPFDYRSMGSSGCISQFQKYCLGGSMDDLYNRWTGNTPEQWNCYNAFQRIVSSSESLNNVSYDLGGEYNPLQQPVGPEIVANISFAINTTEALFNIGMANNIDLSADFEDKGYTGMNSVLFEICTDYPFACKKILDSYCSNETVYSLASTPGNLKWCGCHLPIHEYGKYVDKYGVKKECSPSCNRSNVIPDVYPNIPVSLSAPTPVVLKPVTCENSNICVIDDVNLNYVKGDVNISQICGGCSNNNSACKCIVENDLFIAKSVDINQFCGDDTVFFQTSYNPETGNTVYTKIGDPFEEEEFSLDKTNWGLILVGLIVFFLIIGLLGNYLF